MLRGVKPEADRATTRRPAGPLDPFIDQPGFTLVSRLSWYGQPVCPGDENLDSKGGSPNFPQT
jgi:hypothetical protein